MPRPDTDNRQTRVRHTGRLFHRPLLELRELTKEYERGGSVFAAVDHVNLSLAPKDFISIIGRSGSGKSTLLNMTAGLLKPTSGGVFLEDRDIASLNDREISFVRNAKLGYIPQGQSALANLTVFDNVALPFHLFKREGDIAAKVSGLLEQLGIARLAAAYPKQLSGGELRRLSIARALVNDPAVLVADEPTGDLDPQTTAGIMELFTRIAASGTAVLLVTHDLDATRCGNRVYTMDCGKLAP
jgi:putative ABC transport system ATP-binding protein